MTALSKLFLYIPGIIIFLVGSGMIRTDRRMKALGARFMAKVESCAHVIKKDKKDREVMNYYNVTVSFYDEALGKTQKLNVKSATAFAEDQNVYLFRRGHGQEPVIDDVKEENIFGPWTMTVGGALLILLALFTNQGKEIPAMAMLAIIFVGAGISIAYDQINLKKKNLQKLDSEIIEIYKRQISKETKILRGNKYTYYPIVSYEIDGKPNIRRCNINSSDEKSFKVGKHIALYYDPLRKEVFEKNAKIGFLIAAVILVVLGVLVGGSTVAEAINRGLL